MKESLTAAFVLVCVVVSAQDVDITIEGGTKEDVMARARLLRAAVDKEIAEQNARVQFPDAANSSIGQPAIQTQKRGVLAIVLSFVASVAKLACSCFTVLVIGLGVTVAILRYRDAKAEESKMAEHNKREHEPSAEVADDTASSPNTAPPALNEWREAGKTIFGLVRQTVVALWSKLRPILQDLVAKAESAFTNAQSFWQTNGGVSKSESPQKPSRLANAACFTGIPSLFFCCGPVGIVAMVLGVLALGNAEGNAKPTQQRAILGIVSGALSSVLSLGLMILILAAGTANNANVSEWSLVRGRMSQWDSATQDEKADACAFYLHTALITHRDHFNPAILLILETSSDVNEHQALVDELALDVVDEMNAANFAPNLKVEEAAVRSMVSLGWLERVKFD